MISSRSRRCPQCLRLKIDWAEALKARDTAFFGRTMAEDFMASTSLSTDDRGGMIKELADTAMTFIDVGYEEDHSVRLFADGRLAVLAERDGRMRIIQEHQSEPKK